MFNNRSHELSLLPYVEMYSSGPTTQDSDRFGWPVLVCPNQAHIAQLQAMGDVAHVRFRLILPSGDLRRTSPPFFESIRGYNSIN
jgi:hypothetical protein